MSCHGSFYPFPCLPSPQAPAAMHSCKPLFPVVRKNFTVPATGQEVVVEFTDTSTFFEGQGVWVHGIPFVIKEIIDSIQVRLVHDGINATPGQIVEAVNPAFSCFQKQVVPAGAVTLSAAVALVGLDSAGTAPISGAIGTFTTNAFIFRSEGPTTVSFDYQGEGTLANSPVWIGVQLPANLLTRTAAPRPAFAAMIEEGSGWVPAIGTLGVVGSGYEHYAVVSKSGQAAFSNGANRKIRLSGRFEILV